jgi:hypothetical protein
MADDAKELEALRRQLQEVTDLYNASTATAAANMAMISALLLVHRSNPETGQQHLEALRHTSLQCLPQAATPEARQAIINIVEGVFAALESAALRMDKRSN